MSSYSLKYDIVPMYKIDMRSKHITYTFAVKSGCNLQVIAKLVLPMVSIN